MTDMLHGYYERGGVLLASAAAFTHSFVRDLLAPALATNCD